MPYVITDACIDVKDRACVDACPVDCIYEGPAQFFIHPMECIDCGACALVWENAIEANAAFFTSSPNPPRAAGKTVRRASR